MAIVRAATPTKLRARTMIMIIVGLLDMVAAIMTMMTIIRRRRP
jgi:hypothetical protein